MFILFSLSPKSPPQQHLPFTAVDSIFWFMKW